MDLCEMERYYGGFAEGALPYNPGQRKLKLVLSPNFGKTSGVEYFKVFDDGTHLWIVLDILHIMQLGRFESDLEKLTPGNLDTALIPKTSLDSIAELFIKNNDVFLLNENYFAWTPDQMFRTNISEEARLGSIRIGHPYYWHPIINRKINKRLENLILTYNAITASQAYLKWMDKNFNPRKDWYDYNKVIAVVKGPEWVAKNAKRRGEIVRETSYMIVKGTEPENDEPPKNCKSRRHWKDRTCVHDRDGSWITVTEAVLEQYNATSDDPAYANFSRVPALLSLQEGGWDELVLRTFRKINFRVGGSTISEVVHVDIRHIDNEVDETEVDDIETWNVRPSTRRGGSSEVEDGDANVCLHASNEKSVSWGSYGEGTPGAHFPVNYGKVSLPAKERERGAQVPGQCGKEQPTGMHTSLAKFAGGCGKDLQKSMRKWSMSNVYGTSDNDLRKSMYESMVEEASPPSWDKNIPKNLYARDAKSVASSGPSVPDCSSSEEEEDDFYEPPFLERFKSSTKDCSDSHICLQPNSVVGDQRAPFKAERDRKLRQLEFERKAKQKLHLLRGLFQPANTNSPSEVHTASSKLTSFGIQVLQQNSSNKQLISKPAQLKLNLQVQSPPSTLPNAAFHRITRRAQPQPAKKDEQPTWTRPRPL